MLYRVKQEEFDYLYKIMQDSFPPDEYRAYAAQKALLQKENYQIYTAKDKENDPPKAFAATYSYEDMLFVEHLAVSPTCRNGGLGTLMLRELKRLTDKMICLEVEPPDTDIACRRIDFYRRNGFFLNEYPYMQPPIEVGKSPVPLYLMTTKSPISASLYQKIKNTLYRDVYGIALS